MITALFSNKTTGIASYFQQTSYSSGTVKIGETFDNEYVDIDCVYFTGTITTNGGFVIYDKNIGAIITVLDTPTGGSSIVYSKHNNTKALRIPPNCELRIQNGYALAGTASIKGVRTYVSP